LTDLQEDTHESTTVVLNTADGRLHRHARGRGFESKVAFGITSVARGIEAFDLSLWDDKQNADTHDRAHYALVTKILEKLVEGTPRVETYEVANHVPQDRCCCDGHERQDNASQRQSLARTA